MPLKGTCFSKASNTFDQDTTFKAKKGSGYLSLFNSETRVNDTVANLSFISALQCTALLGCIFPEIIIV